METSKFFVRKQTCVLSPPQRLVLVNTSERKNGSGNTDGESVQSRCDYRRPFWRRQFNTAGFFCGGGRAVEENL